MAYPGTIQLDYGSPYETTTVQLYPMGQRGETPDGSWYRYSLMGGVTGVANKLYQGAATAVANWTTQTHTIALAVGDTEISFDDGGTAFTVNQLEGGSLLVEETDDLGHIYRVKSNVVTASTETICQLEDGVTVQKAVLVEALNVLTANLSPWAEVVIPPATTPTNIVVGVPRVIIAANAFGWVQSRGLASTLAASATLPGNPSIVSGTGGAAGIAASQTTNITGYVGRAMNLAIAGDFAAIWLECE
ncbi:hypothetical protein LCGC14_3009550 [marine sediment metagenome]|uniref:Uncharacterized protein n=1 Tax=marine sediment metagenome TaxID=412755 RepID=A0A0F8XLG1_9ZZZZ